MELFGGNNNRAADYAEANFKLMWTAFSDKDRGVILTGMKEISDDIKTVVRDTYIADANPIYWLEFPMIGEAYMDLSIGYYSDELPENIRIVSDSLKDKERLFEHALKLLKEDDKHNEVCLEFDVSAGETKCPSYGFIPYMEDDFKVPKNKERIKDFFTLIHKEDRIQGAIDVYTKAPDYWKPYYQGISEIRQDVPIRATWLLGGECKKIYNENPEKFQIDLERVGVKDTDDSAIEQMLEVLSLEGNVEFQLDLFEDGSVMSNIGLCVITDYKQEPSTILKNYEDYIKLGLKWGIADDRYKCITPENKVIVIPYYDDDKGMIHKRISMGLGILKFKWSKNRLMPLKGYCFMKSSTSTR